MVGGARPLRRLRERDSQRVCSSRSFVSRCGADHCRVPRFGLIVWAAGPARRRRSAESHGRISARSPPLTRRAVPGGEASGPAARLRNTAGARWARTRHAEPAVVLGCNVDLWAVVNLVGLARRERPRAVRWGVGVGPNTTGTMVSASGSSMSARCRPQCAQSIRACRPPAWIRSWPSDGAQTANGLASPRGASLRSCQRQAIRRTAARRPARSPVPHDSQIGPVGALGDAPLLLQPWLGAICPSVRCTRSCVRFHTTSGQTRSRASRRGIRRV